MQRRGDGFSTIKKVLVPIGVTCIVAALAPSGTGAMQLLQTIEKAVVH